MLREWRELHDALLQEREFLVAKGQLEQDVAEWRAAPDSLKSGALLAGNKLLRTRDWLVTRPQDLSVEERQFIKASVDKDAERRRRNRLAIALAFLILLGFAGYAFYEARRAEAEKLRAEKNATVAEQSAKVAQSEKERADDELKKAQRTQSLLLADLAHQQRSAGDPGTAVLLALEALPDRTAGTTRPYVPEPELQLDGAWRDQRERLVLVGHEGAVWSAAFSPDGKRIVTASSDQTPRLWDGETGKPIGEPLRGHENRVVSAAFGPDGKRIVTASWDKTARLWGETGKPIGDPHKGHEDKVESAAFSPDGKRIVTASADQTARLWDGETGKPIGEPLKGHELSVESAVFSPDGRRIVTASSDETARLWDAETGKPIGELKHRDLAWSAAFSPDGKRIVTASDDETARLWKIFANTQELVSHAKADIPRCLTTVQRNTFFLSPEPPPWCIEMEKWPYNTPVWKQWLADTRAGNNPPLPALPFSTEK